MVEEENRRELHEGLRRISAREQAYLLYRFGFEDDMEHPLIGTALHFHLSESRAKSCANRAAARPYWMTQNQGYAPSGHLGFSMRLRRQALLVAQTVDLKLKRRGQKNT